MSTISAHSTANLLQNIDRRILIGVIAFAVAATVGATSLVGAQPDGKPSKEWCQKHGYRNYGQCVKDWAHSHGYGGNSNENSAEINNESNQSASSGSASSNGNGNAQSGSASNSNSTSNSVSQSNSH